MGRRPAREPGAIGELRYYGWNGLTMPWFGLHDEKSAIMAIVPYDGSVGVQWVANYNRNAEIVAREHRPSKDPRILALTPVWDLEATTPETRVNYHVLPGGNHVSMAKRYRRIAEANGLLVTLKEKARQNPDVNKLAGAIYTTTLQEATVSREGVPYLRLLVLGAYRVVNSLVTVRGLAVPAPEETHTGLGNDGSADTREASQIAICNRKGKPMKPLRTCTLLMCIGPLLLTEIGRARAAARTVRTAQATSDPSAGRVPGLGLRETGLHAQSG